MVCQPTGCRHAVRLHRVSTIAQTLHQQHDALKAAGASKIYSDTMSGARDDRPGLAALMDQLRR